MAKSKKQPEVMIHNFVAKHMHEVNRSHVFTDRKKMQNAVIANISKGDILMIIALPVSALQPKLS